MSSLPNIKAYSGNGNYIFVSYSHRDKSIAYPFIAALQKKYNVWFDEGIHYGQEWEEEISNKLKHCTAFIFIVSETSLKSVNCKDELYHARELEKIFLNILTEGTIKLPDWFSFRYGRYQMCKLFAFPTVESALEDLERKCEWFADLGIDVADGSVPDQTAEPEETVSEDFTFGAYNETVAPLLKRVFIFLEDEEWTKADEYCERILDRDPENAQAYLGKLMAELQVSHQTDLANCEQPFDNRGNYKKAVRFGGDQMASILSGYITHINKRKENLRKSEIYGKAISAMEAAKTAYEFRAVANSFKSISGFQNSDALSKKCFEKAKSLFAVLQTVAAGDTFFCGRYQLQRQGEPNPIEWIVLKKRARTALIVSKYALDCQPYDTSYSKYVTWKTCSLRQWLNGTFLNAAFSSEEQNSIISSTVDYGTGNNTTDKVFLLSIPEVKEYFSSNEARKCAPTDYAEAQGTGTRINYTTSGTVCPWWLRSPVYDSDRGARVRIDGSVDTGYNVSSNSVAVRPALWINLGS